MGIMGVTSVMIYSYHKALLPPKKEYIYSPSNKLFYHPSTPFNKIPDDYVLMTEDEANIIIEQNNSAHPISNE